jgi:polyisoprenoid-binding protein YceI
MASSAKRRWPRWLIGGVVVVAVLVVGGPFVYIHFIEGPAPAKLSLSTPTTPQVTTSSGTRAPLAGTWKVGTGSTAGYRIQETLFGQHSTAVGRTDAVTGTMTIVGTNVTRGSFTVDMTSITSDRGIRDSQFQGRIMETSSYPTATFVLTTPIALQPVPHDGIIKNYEATGNLTLHGTTRTVTIPLTAQRVGNVLEVQGILTVTFSDYHINNPSGGPASVGNAGQMEFLLHLQPS